jgi:adenosyl cobinamide kinase/adenosyl cobinamide phosphate guanylyltransferase
MGLTLVLGPRRSGKSAAAERIAASAGGEVVYIAPLTVTDGEMERRVNDHRKRRPSSWNTIETADIVSAVEAAPADAAVLLDSLGTWIAELLWRAGALDADSIDPSVTDRVLADVRRLASASAPRAGELVVVCEETGWGPVPTAPATRRWLDIMGDAVQELSREADRVLLVVAGRTLELA